MCNCSALRRKKKKGGFTLIELLVVISVIGLLATVVLVSLNTGRAKARDAKRKETIRQISIAMQLYYGVNQQYPVYTTNQVSTGTWPSNIGTFMASVPVDPVNTATYQYRIRRNDGTSGQGTNQQFCVLARKLETESGGFYYSEKGSGPTPTATTTCPSWPQ